MKGVYIVDNVGLWVIMGCFCDDSRCRRRGVMWIEVGIMESGGLCYGRPGSNKN